MLLWVEWAPLGVFPAANGVSPALALCWAGTYKMANHMSGSWYWLPLGATAGCQRCPGVPLYVAGAAWQSGSKMKEAGTAHSLKTWLQKF